MPTYNEIGGGGLFAGGLAARSTRYAVAASGGVKVSGCPLVDELFLFVTPFGPGDTAYRVDKARFGILEKVVIRYIKAVSSLHLGPPNAVLYQDTFNALWDEDDLVTYEAAVALADAYLSKAAALIRAANKC